MFLVELVMQGVRGIRELARVRFQSGFNFVAAGNESGKTSSTDAIVRLLFPSSDPEATASMVSRHTPDASRAALVAFSDEGAYYRVIEDFSKRAVNVSKYNPATKDFTLLHKDWPGTTAFMAELTAGITEEEYKRLFILRRDHYTGHNGAPAVRTVPAAARPVQARPAPSRAASAAAEARLAELRETLQKAEEAADADYRAHAAKLKLEDLRKKLVAIEELDGRSQDLEFQLSELAGCETLPDNINELIQEHDIRQSRKMAETDKLAQEIEGLQHQFDEMPKASFVTDKWFVLGALAGGVSIAIGMFFPDLIPQEYFPVGVLVALFLMALSWYNGSRKNTQRNLVAKEIEILQHDLEEVEKSFEHGGAAILECMKATGSQTTGELEDKAGNYRYFISMRQDLAGQRQRIFGESTHEAFMAEYEQLQQEVVELEKQAAAVARYALDTYSIRQEIERVESEFSGTAASPDFDGAQGFSEASAAAASQSGSHDFFSDLEIASRVGGIEMETLLPAVESAAQRNLASITGGRYLRIEAGRGANPVLHAKDDSVVSFEDLSHGTRDVAYFCLRAGMVEALAGKRRLPFILDDPFGGFDPARQQAACHVLRALGAKTQVILYTSTPALKAAGDVAGELK